MTSTESETPSIDDAIESMNLILSIDDGLECLNLTTRCFNAYSRNGITTIGDLISKCACQLLDMRSIGTKSVCDTIDQLHEHGFKLSTCNAYKLNND